MSDDTAPTPESSDTPDPESAPRVRRASPPRPKKAAKVKENFVEPSAPPPAPDQLEATTSPTSEQMASPSSAGENEWPEPEAASAGATSPNEGTKRKRRRRKGKGQPSSLQPIIPTLQDEPEGPATQQNGLGEPSPSTQAPRPPAVPVPFKGQPPPPPSPRTKIDPELLTKMAWKIYLAEVSEEGVALIGDNDAKDLSRRCFRLAEIFIEEQSRRR